MNVRTPGRTSMWRACNAALDDAMAEDDAVFVMGEDITTWGTGGGAFGVTRGLLKKYGAERVRMTPISEEGVVGAAVGAAMAGLRPVVEIMFLDAALMAFDGMANQAAKARYMFGGQYGVPMVLRAPQGSWPGKAAQHSQSLETLFAYVPGLEVVVPGDAADSYGLMRTAIRSDNPTVFLEHKLLYQDVCATSYEPIPFGQARIVRRGSDVTVVATQLARKHAVAAAEALEAEGISVEIVDPRTLYPLDLDTIYGSVRHTRRLLVVHEAPRMYGFGGELMSSIVEECYGELVARPRRLGAARVPIPYSPHLEENGGLLVTQADIEQAVRDLIHRDGDRENALEVGGGAR